MAHIPDGMLIAPVLAAGAAITVAGCAYGLKRLEAERIPQAALMSAVFFVAALVHFPVGPSSLHLMLGGLMGIVLGWAAFPAILVALLLQAVMFGFGGVAVLGVNAMNMAVPAVLCGLAFRAVSPRLDPRRAALLAGALGAASVLLTSLMVALSLGLSGREFIPAAQLVVLTNIPLMGIEAAFTAALAGLILKVRPGMMGEPSQAMAAAE